MGFLNAGFYFKDQHVATYINSTSNFLVIKLELMNYSYNSLSYSLLLLMG